MEWQILTWARLANAAAGGLIILAVGSLAARLCRQPVRRARLIVLTLIGALAVPWLAVLPVAPRWSTGLLPALAPRRPSHSQAALPDFSSGRSRSILASDVRQTLDPIGRSGETLADSARKEPDVARSESLNAVPSWHSMKPSARTLILGSYVAVMVGLTAWWSFGMFILWRITRVARPVPTAVRDVLLAIAGTAGAQVRLFASDSIALPFTYTVTRPVILLPATLCDSKESEALRYVLAHEWSHVERRDSWAWSFTSLAGLVLFYQPLFWWLRRQLRLCQDYLADARASATGSAEDYAAYLVGLARIHRFGPSLPALGIGGRRSNLYRRASPCSFRTADRWSNAAGQPGA